MTDKDLKRLSRSDLLEMLLDLSKENDALRKENQQLHQQLEDRTIAIENCGTLAEAALQINGVFQTAHAACEQYMQNIRERSNSMEQFCSQMEMETQRRCEAMIEEAKNEVLRIRESAQQQQMEKDNTFAWVMKMLQNGEK